MKEIDISVFATAITVCFDVAKRWRIKFIDGECHVFKHFAGIVRGRRDAFFFRNGIFRAMNEILCRAFDTNNGEKAE